MAKIIQDTFEQLAELGKTTAQQTVKSVVQTLNPLKIFEQTGANLSNDKGDTGIEKLASQNNGSNSSPLDFEKLQKKYDEQDKGSLDAMRQRLFQLVKSDEQKAIDERKREEQERKRKEQEEEERKRREEEEAQAQNAQSAAPQGKVRKTIGAAHKKAAMETHQEVKGNKGKN